MSVRLAQLRAARSGLGGAAGAPGAAPSPCDLPGQPPTISSALAPPSHAAALAAELRARGRVAAPQTGDELKGWAERSGDAAAVLLQAVQAAADAAAARDEASRTWAHGIANAHLPFPGLPSTAPPPSLRTDAPPAAISLYIQHAANRLFCAYLLTENQGRREVAAEAAAREASMRWTSIAWAVTHLTRMHTMLTWPGLAGCEHALAKYCRNAVVAVHMTASNVLLPRCLVQLHGARDTCALLRTMANLNENVARTGELLDMRCGFGVAHKGSDADAAVLASCLEIIPQSLRNTRVAEARKAVPVTRADSDAGARELQNWVAGKTRSSTQMLVADLADEKQVAALLRVVARVCRQVNIAKHAGQSRGTDAYAVIAVPVAVPDVSSGLFVVLAWHAQHERQRLMEDACAALELQPLPISHDRMDAVMTGVQMALQDARQQASKGKNSAGEQRDISQAFMVVHKLLLFGPAVLDMAVRKGIEYTVDVAESARSVLEETPRMELLLADANRHFMEQTEGKGLEAVLPAAHHKLAGMLSCRDELQEHDLDALEALRGLNVTDLAVDQ